MLPPIYDSFVFINEEGADTGFFGWVNPPILASEGEQVESEHEKRCKNHNKTQAITSLITMHAKLIRK